MQTSELRKVLRVYKQTLKLLKNSHPRDYGAMATTYIAIQLIRLTIKICE